MKYQYELLVFFLDHSRGQQVVLSFLLNEEHSEQNAKATQHLKSLQPFSQPEVGDKPGSDGLEGGDYSRPSGSKIINAISKYAKGDNGADADRVKYQQPGFRVPAHGEKPCRSKGQVKGYAGCYQGVAEQSPGGVIAQVLLRVHTVKSESRCRAQPPYKAPSVKIEEV